MEISHIGMSVRAGVVTPRFGLLSRDLHSGFSTSGLCGSESPVISADGRAVYITVSQPEPTGGPRWTRLLEAPAGGGQPRILLELRYQPHGGNLVYMWGPVCHTRTAAWPGKVANADASR
jgi:hypothetical protein